MPIFRIGWVNPQPGGEQVPVLREHCKQLHVNYETTVASGRAFNGACVTCDKKPAFTVVYNTHTKKAGWACKKCKDDFKWRGCPDRPDCCICETDKVALLPSDVRNPAAYGKQYYPTCAACTPRVRTVLTGCFACDLLFQGGVCMRHELMRGTLKQCPACKVLHRKKHVCEKQTK
tara:strand:- start:29 stop:553 length:525 start_codon:yes stop_codon:yes gene_type:complete